MEPFKVKKIALQKSPKYGSINFETWIIVS